MRKNSTIYVAGGETLLGSALRRALEREGYARALPAACEPDPTDAAAVGSFFARYRPEYVFVAAGRSGGIEANRRYPADLLRDNLLCAANLIHAAHEHGVRKLLYLASSCSYPRDAAQPLSPASLLTGPFEPTNEAYAVAKVAGQKMCEAYRRQHGDRFITAIPANAFGPGDDFAPESAHVIPALIRRMHEARIAGEECVTIWGTGRPRREFVYADDIADACLFAMTRYDGEAPLNLGGGPNLSIRQLADAVRDVVGFEGETRYDASKPDGMPLKALDSSVLRAMGWRPRTPFREALEKTYAWFLSQEGEQDAGLVSAEARA